MDRLIIGSILRKLPLKLLLIILALFGVFMFCYSSADFSSPVLLQTYTTQQSNKSYSNSAYPVLCIENGNCGKEVLIWNFTNGNGIFYTSNDGNGMGMACTINGTIYFNTRSACEFKIYGIQYNEYTSLQCQTEYNLIPISSVDSNYCVNNNLCPSEDCPEYPDNPNLGTSNIYINDVFHPGAFNVIVNIPEEIDWDYAYTNSGSNFNLDVVGYNQDTEYINGLIDVNNYKPTSEDFNNIFGMFSSFSGLLVVCLFVILVFYFIKKLFK